MFITDKEASDRLQSKNNFLRTPVDATPDIDEKDVEEKDVEEKDEPQTSKDELEVKTHHFRGRKVGDTAIPAFMKVLLGTAAQFDSQTNVAREFGVSLPIVQAAANGNEIKNNIRVESPEIKNAIDAVNDKAKKTAADKLMMALGLIDHDRLSQAKVKDISSIAKDMASVIEKVTPKTVDPNAGTKIVIYSPQIRQENHYDTVPA